MSMSPEGSPVAEAPLATGIARLLAIMARLRDLETGCEWDVAQTFATIVPYTIEEAYEVADAIEQNDLPALREELGDLLLQVVFHARMAEELGAFDFDAVAHAISDKMTERHPHIFGDVPDQGHSREFGPTSHQRRQRLRRRPEGMHRAAHLMRTSSRRSDCWRMPPAQPPEWHPDIAPGAIPSALA